MQGGDGVNSGKKSCWSTDLLIKNVNCLKINKLKQFKNEYKAVLYFFLKFFFNFRT